MERDKRSRVSKLNIRASNSTRLRSTRTTAQILFCPQRTASRDISVQWIAIAKLRWSTAEWAYEAFDIGKDYFRGVGECLSSLDRSWPDKSFIAFRQQYLATMVSALGDLEAEGFFGVGDAREKVTVFATVSDSELAEGLERKSVRKVNPRSVYQRFIHRFA
jgi:hypothetical protein